MSIETQLRLGLKDQGRAVSADDFADAVFDEPYKYEREDGMLIVLHPDGFGHQSASEPWRDALVYYKRDHPGVIRNVFTGSWVRPDDRLDRIGDVGVYLQGSPIPDEGQPTPDLMFEIVSKGKVNRERDYVNKRAEYEALGVKEYVIVDRFDRRVTVLSLGPEGYAERVLTEADPYESPLLPGLAIPVSSTFGG